MYATSKLIIPAKTAQDSPYVPKIRIFLRPSSSLDKSSDMGSSLAPDSFMADISQENHNEDNAVKDGDKTKDVNFPSTVPQNQTDKVSKPLQDQIRGGRKRKLVGSLDNIDFERRDSLLTKVNLKKIINMDTFEALPMDSRRHLLSLLPIYDQTPPPDATASATDADYWIHPTALNNEFLSKALQDYSIRQMNGEFSPRLNSRTGLRKSVGNRQRYSSPAVSPISIPHSSTPLLQPSANTTKEEPISTPLVVTSSPLKTNGVESPTSRFRNKSSALQTVLSKELMEPKIENDIDKEGLQEAINAKLEKEQHVIPQSVFSHFVSTSSTAIAATSSASSSSSTLSSSPSPHCASSSSPSSGLSPTALGSVTNATNSMLPLQSLALDELERQTMRPSPAPSEVSIQRRPNMPKLESTLLLQNGVKPPLDLSLSSPRRSTIGASSRRPSQTGADLPSSSRPPLVVDSTTPISAPNPTTMPPPRETKTLASVREKLRAKRLMMSQQHPCQSLPPKVPCQQRSAPSLAPASLSESAPAPPPATGSLTPNPGTSFSGDFYSCPTARQEPLPPISAPVIQPPAVLIQPTGNSVSAPATPQHGSAGGGIAGPLPAILANFKQARVVVTPSRSGSSVSSNEGGTDVADPDHQLPDVHSQPQAIPQKQQQQQQAIHQKQPVPQQPQQLVAVPASACSVGGGTTTTRAFFVDGNNLTETLALLQSINPRATVTQQQFLLIPSTDKSHAILCRTPIAIQPKQAPPQPQVIRRHSGSACATAACPPVSAPATPTVLPLILPANRSQEHQQQQVPAIPPGLYREILPNNNTTASVCNIQRVHQPTPIQPQQQPTQLRPAQTYYSLLAPSTITASGANTNHNNVSSTNHNISTTNSNNNPLTSFLPPPS
ncbi:Polycomb group protein ASXL2 [Echinococcus multilocularis]|uniref:Polycomb group protein ASXL2 n=1 Tax=Echinococcus multilocularis TaxID=6211 RepID=A0A068Y5T4_ECHMU|nr:Polycomb group protein ASXL2 [Echinococcus multilocularis]